MKGIREVCLDSALFPPDLNPSQRGRVSAGDRDLLLPAGLRSRNFVVQRILVLAVLLGLEWAVLSVWFFYSTQPVGTKHDWAALLLRCIAGFATILLPCGYLKNKSSLDKICGPVEQTEQTPIRWSLLATHFAAIIAFGRLSALLYSRGGLSRIDLLAAAWLVCGISAIAFAGLTFLPAGVWNRLVRRTGRLWAFALIIVISAIATGPHLQIWLWHPGTAVRVTFHLTKMILSPFVSGIVANPATLVIGTRRFRVQIAPGCSGLEGVGLVLAFAILWLAAFRKEYRFPQALSLIPVGVALIFLLNSARIAALVLIGNAGFPKIAVNGFHSEAGWIACSAVCLGFGFVVQSVPWFAAAQPSRESRLASPFGSSFGRGVGAIDRTTDIAMHNPSAAFLAPFVMILAAGMIAGAAKGAGSIEWLYPLRFFAGAGTLWIFRRSYADLSWKCDWVAPVAGAVVFVIWIALDRFASPAADREVSAALMASPGAVRIAWIAFRVLASVVTVPLAEELAFRGFLMRRLISPDFDSVSFRRFSWFALLASSLTFGILHGGYWISGSIAGILFGLLMIRRGRIGEAVVAHATANALLAAYVLAYHCWHLW